MLILSSSPGIGVTARISDQLMFFNEQPLKTRISRIRQTILVNFITFLTSFFVRNKVYFSVDFGQSMLYKTEPGVMMPSKTVSSGGDIALSFSSTRRAPVM